MRDARAALVRCTSTLRRGGAGVKLACGAVAGALRALVVVALRKEEVLERSRWLLGARVKVRKWWRCGLGLCWEAVGPDGSWVAVRVVLVKSPETSDARQLRLGPKGAEQGKPVAVALGTVVVERGLSV